MSAWKSRWSWERFVNTATSQWMASARASASACEETSMTTAASPASRIARERPLEVDRLGRRPDGVVAAPAHDRADRPQQAGPQPARLQQRADEEGRRRLAVRAGDAHGPQGGRGVAGQAGGRRRHRAAHVVDEDLRDAQPERALHDQGDGAAGDRLGREVVPVAGEARDAEEQRPRLHGAGVEGERGHLDVARRAGQDAGGDASAGDDVGEQHQRRSVERAAGAPLTAAGCRGRTARTT